MHGRAGRGQRGVSTPGEVRVRWWAVRRLGCSTSCIVMSSLLRTGCLLSVASARFGASRRRDLAGRYIRGLWLPLGRLQGAAARVSAWSVALQWCFDVCDRKF